MPSRRALLSSIAGAGLLGTAGCLGYPESVFSAGSDADTDWPSPRFDAEQSAYNPDAKAPRKDATDTWAARIGRPVASPVVADGTVFLATWSALVAVDVESGEERWRFAPENARFSAPTVRSGVVYVGESDDCYALDAESGEELWHVEDATAEAAPLFPREEIVHDPPVVVGNRDGVVRALDPDSGEERWRVDVFGSVRTLAWRLRGPYIGTGGGEVYAFSLSADEPRELWRTKVSGPVESLTPTENGLYVETFGGPFETLFADQAGVVGRTVGAAHANTAGVHAKSWVYSAGYNTLSSLREWDNNVHWRVGGRYDYADPVAAGDRLYVAGEKSVHAFDLDGGIGAGTNSFDVKRWSQKLPGGVKGMAVADGALFVAIHPDGAVEQSLFRLDEA